MRCFIKLRPPLLVVLVLGLDVGALVGDTSANPYQVIVDSNCFHLAPPRQQANDPTVLELPRIRLVGITTFGEKRALLKVNLPARPPEPARELSCVLSIGQWEGLIQLVDIDETTGRVTVCYSGKVILLTLANEKPGPQPMPLPPKPPPPPLPLPKGPAIGR